MSNWKRLSFGLAVFVVLFAFSIAVNQTIRIYFDGSVPHVGLALSFLISILLLLIILYVLIRWRSKHPFLIWLPTLFALPLFVSILVGVCPECKWATKRVEMGAGELAVTYQTTAYSGVSQVGAVGNNGLWVADIANDSVVLLNPQDYGILKAFPVGHDPIGIALGFDSIWTADYSDGTVTRLDAADGYTRAVIEVGGNPLLLATSEDAVWLTDQDRNTVTRINPRTNAVDATINVGMGPVGVAASPGGVWVALSQEDKLALIDPTSNEVLQHLPASGNPLNLVIHENDLWVVCPSTGLVYRFDHTSGERKAIVKVEGEPTGIAVDGRYAWVARSANNDVVRIGLDDNDVVGDPLPTGELPKNLVSDGRGGVWVMEEGANKVSHFTPAASVRTSVEEPLESWFASWLPTTLRTSAVMATYGTPFYLVAGQLSLSLALLIHFNREKRTDIGFPFLWTTAILVLLALPLLGIFWDKAIAVSATLAAIIAYIMVIRLTEPEEHLTESVDSQGDTVELATP